MKTLSISLVLFLTVQLAHAKNFEMKSMSLSAQKTTEQYNKNLNVANFLNSKLEMDESFLKEFKAHLKMTNTNEFLKAQLIGDTVFFKNKKIQLKLKPIEIKNSYVVLMQINGKSMTLNVKDGFKKNYARLESLTQQKNANLWDIIIPKAYADELKAPKELEAALDSALSWSSWAISAVSNEGKIEKEKICKLNEKESKSYTPGFSSEITFEEIKYFVEVQNKYVKPLIQNDSGYIASGGTECTGKCEWAQEFESCLMTMAERRKDAISASEVYGLSCFKRYEDNGVYLSSDLLSQPLQSYGESYEGQLKSIEHDTKFECGTIIDDHREEKALCNKRMVNRLAELNARCPPDEKAASIVPNSKSRTLTNSGSR